MLSLSLSLALFSLLFFTTQTWGLIVSKVRVSRVLESFRSLSGSCTGLCRGAPYTLNPFLMESRGALLQMSCRISGFGDGCSGVSGGLKLRLNGCSWLRDMSGGRAKASYRGLVCRVVPKLQS